MTDAVGLSLSIMLSQVFGGGAAWGLTVSPVRRWLRKIDPELNLFPADCRSSKPKRCPYLRGMCRSCVSFVLSSFLTRWHLCVVFVFDKVTSFDFFFVRSGTVL